MARFLVIGFGNPLRSDDGVGYVVAQRLATELSKDIKVIAAHQLLPEMAEELSRAEHAVFVDASQNGEPGTVVEHRLEPTSGLTDSHGVNPAGILQLSQQLYGKSPGAHLLTIAGESFDTGDRLSASVAEAVPEVIKRVKALLRT